MCGIAGVIGEVGATEADVLRMAGVLAHRGPDDEGVFTGPGVALAHRRLAILDLSPAGRQPMANEDGSLRIVFNGEIYNHAELREELSSASHRFRSHSDTEVILHAYEEWGAGCVERFVGMWAFAIWDERRREAFLSRDRFGIKPLYYHIDPRTGTLVFGSEIKAVLAWGLPARLNAPYAARVLTTSRLDDGPETFFNGVSQLPPAHHMTLRDRVPRLHRYWDFGPEQAEELRESSGISEYASAEELAAGLRDLLAEAVRIRALSADVQVGSCLSGGIDSSSIVALASPLFNVPMATFTVAYAGTDCDESEYARLVAGRFGCQAYSVTPGPDDFADTLAEQVWHQDEPPTGPGLYSQWSVMRLAGSQVKVVLDGQGGDELMAGYRYHLESFLRSRLRAALAGRDGAVRDLTKELRAVARTWGLPVPLAAARAFGSERMKRAYLAAMGSGQGRDLTAQLRSEVRRDPVGGDGEPRFADPLAERLYRDLTRDVIPALLHYEDRNSMAFSVEARVPFLDHRVVEYALSLPAAEKVADGESKRLMRMAMRGTVPDEVLDRRDKKGYATPADAWLRGPLLGRARDLLLDGATRSRGVLEPAVVKRKLEAHASGRLDLSWQIYRWMALEQWFRTFVDVRDGRLGPTRS